MHKIVLQVYAVFVALLAIGGLFVEGEHLFGIMNGDAALDILRIILAAALLYIAFLTSNAQLIRGTLLVIGVLYLGIGLLGLFDATLWGMLPTGLTGFDIVLHLATGALAAIVALIPSNTESVSV